MKDTNEQNDRNKPRRTGKNSQEIGVVRVVFKPGPDAEDRLRRAMALMIKYATRDRQAADGENAPPEEPQSDYHAEAGD